MRDRRRRLRFGRRRGWLPNYHLTVADGAGGFAPVGKTFKGLTDRQFAEMTERLRQLQLADDGYTVTVRPDVVVEVAYNESKPARNTVRDLHCVLPASPEFATIKARDK